MGVTSLCVHVGTCTGVTYVRICAFSSVAAGMRLRMSKPTSVLGTGLGRQ